MTDLAVVNIRAIVFVMCDSFACKKSLMISASSQVLQPPVFFFLVFIQDLNVSKIF